MIASDRADITSFLLETREIDIELEGRPFLVERLEHIADLEVPSGSS
jgi:hypothetical protein